MMAERMRMAAEAAYVSLGVQPSMIEVSSESDLEAALAEAARQHADAVDIALALPLTAAIMQAALRHRLPTMVSSGEFVEAGGLVSFWPDLEEGEQRVAAIIDKVLRGARPANLPIEQPTKFELVLNLHTARALGITVPRSLILRADRTIH
jgi:putative ABC transport system substrate-binding protein